ncbi:putative DNA-binding domain-containing protein [Pseudooceanicola sp. CBS1P-1]|uniref:DUF2063 domain-containing protein n=1 Tax=Pseudooceanicola albus TaxID=2692189 RepID=A0A6L7G1D5_9RHOB|nr:MULTISPECIES: DNA-binding domain-containing protein [Pseudooceanicola]MBT9382728.1 putative DNA-binding domain-containing protein [Pseudooceanicola endophyticus]MXN17266.1 DUF2063 domain-containing protein [Pseudooceanicola albus]
MSEGTLLSALRDPEGVLPSGLHDGRGGPATRRFAVYRNNIAVSLREAIVTGFPTLLALLGPRNMAQLARAFVQGHPPTSPVLLTYGTELPAFLDGFAPLATLPYLADAARLDLALRRAYHAADADPIPPEALGLLSQTDLGRAVLILAPAVQVLRSNWPLHDIWRLAHQDGPPPGAQAQDLLITRAHFDPACHALSPGAAAFLQACLEGRSAAEALEQARTEAPAFDLSALLALLLAQRALCTLEIPQ